MAVTNFIAVSFLGAAGEQFGRSTFTTMVPFKSIERFFVIDEAVQRKLNGKKANEIAGYVLKGLKQNNMCFLSAVTTTCRGQIEWDENTRQVSIDINAHLSVNDGQHRVEGIKRALKLVRDSVSKASSAVEKQELSERLNRLENMSIPVVIFASLPVHAEQQLFHDLNLLASKPTKSISLKFDNTDPYNLLAKELKGSNQKIAFYGIETEKTQIKGTNTNLMLLSTLRNTISYIVSGSEKDTSGVLNDDTFEDWFVTLNQIFDRLFESLPEDCNDRSKYIIGTAATFQGIGKYIHSLLEEHPDNWEGYLSGLRNINWRHDNRMWHGYGGSYDSEKGIFIFSGTGAGVNGVYQALKENNRHVSL